MSEIDDRIRASIAKRDSGNFTLNDVSEYLQKKAKPETKVYALKLQQWVKVNNYQLFLKSVSGDMDDAWIHVVVKNHNPWLNWLILPIASHFAKDDLVVWWQQIPNTLLMLDVWYVGDGSGGVPLVFEVM